MNWRPFRRGVATQGADDSDSFHELIEQLNQVEQELRDSSAGSKGKNFKALAEEQKRILELLRSHDKILSSAAEKMFS